MTLGSDDCPQVLLADCGHVLFAGTAGSRLHLFTINGLLVWSWTSAGSGVSALSLTPYGDGLICGFDDGQLCVWRLSDREPLVTYEQAPAPIVCLAVTDAHLLVGTSRAELLMYLPPPRFDDGRAGRRVLSPTPAGRERRSHAKRASPRASEMWRMTDRRGKERQGRA